MEKETDIGFLIVVFSVSFFIISIILIIIILSVYKQKIRREKEIRAAIYHTQEVERNRMSDDLHDNIGAKLSALKLFCESLKQDPTLQLLSKLDNIMEISNETVIELRNIIRGNSGDYILRNGFVAELKILIDRLSALPIQINMQIIELFPRLDNQFGVNLFRIIQELINNSIKHSGCNNISINLSIDDSANISLLYTDNGKEFDFSSLGNGLGLRNINARVRMFDGDLSHINNKTIIKFPVK